MRVCLSEVGVAADGAVGCVNAAEQTVRCSDIGTWKQINGGLSRISAGSSTSVWGVNAAGNIFRYTQDDANPWIQIPGGLSDIGAAADGTVWGVNSAGNIFSYSRTGTWPQTKDDLTAIWADSRPQDCGLNSDA